MLKDAFRDVLSFFKKNSFIKKSVEQSSIKECEKRCHKKSQLRKFFKYEYDNFILENIKYGLL